MKRTSFQKNTIGDQRKLNTDEQNTSEFHPADISFKEQHPDPKDIPQVTSLFG